MYAAFIIYNIKCEKRIVFCSLKNNDEVICENR